MIFGSFLGLLGTVGTFFRFCSCFLGRGDVFSVLFLIFGTRGRFFGSVSAFWDEGTFFRFC